MRGKFGWMTRYAMILFLTIPDGYRDDEQPTLEDDVSSFKATSEIREHKEVIKKVLDWLIGIMYCVMEDKASELRPMWYAKLLSLDHERFIDSWKSIFSKQVSSYAGFTLGHLNGEDSLLYV
jgi:hypothetical protein